MQITRQTLRSRSPGMAWTRRPYEGAAAVCDAIRRFLLHPVYALYTRHLWSQVQRWPVPRHLAVILDGNRRFARSSGLESLRDGYALGAHRVFDVIAWSQRSGVQVLTVWAVSLDNLERPPGEVEQLFQVLEEAVQGLTAEGKQRGWRLRAIGRRDLLPSSLAACLERAEQETCRNQGLIVQLAIGYGGQEEIVDALRRWAEDQGVRGQSLEHALGELQPERLRAYLYGADLPDPDLILRTSGEVRLSGFLLWQSAHCEFYFTDVLWPAFREVDFLRALRSYAGRHRRFGL